MNSKRILYTIGAIAAVLLIVYLGYLFANRDTTTAPGNETSGTLPSDQPGGANNSGNPSNATNGVASLNDALRLTYDKPVDSYFATATSGIVLVQKDGQIMKIGTDGKAETLNAAPVPTLVASSFSRDGRRVMILFGDHMRKQLSIFDTETRSWRGPFADVESASWSPNTDEIAFLKAQSSGGYQLVIQDFKSANSTARVQTALSLNDLVIDWVHPDKISLQERASSRTKGSVWLFDVKKKVLSPVLAGNLGATAKWDPSATQMVLFTSASRRNDGGIVSLRSGNGTLLNSMRFLTLPEKCFFEKETQPRGVVTSTAPWVSASQFLLCGIPRNSEDFENASLPDDYQKRSLFAIDNIFRIDLSSGDVEFLFADGNKYFDVTAMSTKNRRLYFVNGFDYKLYSLSLDPL